MSYLLLSYVYLVCSNINLLKPNTLCTTSFNIQQFYVLPTMHLCVLCGSLNKQRLFPYTALTYRIFKTEAECLLRGTNWVFKSDRYSFVLKRLKSLIQDYRAVAMLYHSLTQSPFFLDSVHRLNFF